MERPGVQRGAETWGNGATGQSVTGFGAVSAANSIIGSTNNDEVGGQIAALSNGTLNTRPSGSATICCSSSRKWSLSRAIVQSEELGVSLVGVMQTQSHEVRVSRRRAAEADALRAPVKMLIPLVIFILPTLFMLLLGPVLLRAGAAFSGAGAP